MLLVFIRSYLKALLKYKFLIRNIYHPDTIQGVPELMSIFQDLIPEMMLGQKHYSLYAWVQFATVQDL
jgi:hypothetical protein